VHGKCNPGACGKNGKASYREESVFDYQLQANPNSGSLKLVESRDTRKAAFRDSSRTWVKGEYAYLAPNAAGLLLSRCNIKHDLCEEADLSQERLDGYRALFIPNAAHLADDTIARIECWLSGPIAA